VQTAAVGVGSTVSLSCGSLSGCVIAPASVAAGQSATVTFTPASTSIGESFSLSVTGDNGFTLGSAAATVQVLSFAFNLTAPLPQQDNAGNYAVVLEAGQSASLNYNLQPYFVDFPSSPPPPYDVPITLACPNAPSGVHCTFTPASVANLSKSEGGALGIQVDAGAAAGTTRLDLKATGGTLSRDVTLDITVNQFTITAAPASQNVLAGMPATFTVAATSVAGFNGNIALSCSNFHGPFNASGGSCSFQRAAIAVGQSSVVSVSGVDGTQPAVMFTITGSSSGSVSSASAAIDPENFFVAWSGLPRSVTLPGSSGISGPVSVAGQNYTLPVTLSCANTLGLSCSFNPATINPGQQSTLTVTGMASLPPMSDIPITLIGTSTAAPNTTLQNSSTLDTANNGGVAITAGNPPLPIFPGDATNFSVYPVATNSYLGAITVTCGQTGYSCSVTGGTATLSGLMGTPGATASVPV
ncbi:MAG: hypothetical protein ACRD1E_03065, partial [Terriglobales bacterium]